MRFFSVVAILVTAAVSWAWTQNEATPTTSAPRDPAPCGPEDPPSPPDRVPLLELPGEERAELFRKDVLNIRDGFSEELQRIRALSPEARLQVLAAAKTVVQTCPYSAATVDLIVTVGDRLDRYRIGRPGRDGSATPVSRSEELSRRVEIQESTLSALASALDVHRDLLSELGVVGPATFPPTSDAMFRTLGEVRDRVNALSAAGKSEIQRAHDVMAQHTAGLWLNKFLIICYSDSIRKLLTDSGMVYEMTKNSAHRDVNRRSRRIQDSAMELISMIGHYMALYC